ncbi:hypothetical protein COTS27_01302 [Spirochaetota bacterium]|nr:hypothetical protein COTS27_01302 [Spirochaetota bacterium]
MPNIPIYVKDIYLVYGQKYLSMPSIAIYIKDALFTDKNTYLYQ